MTIFRDFLIATAGSALMLALPVAAQAQGQAQPEAQPQTPLPGPADQPAPVPPADPTMAVPAASQPAAATAQPPVADAGVAKEYPRCSATVTDSCIQGGSKAKSSKSSHRKKT